MGAPAPCPHAYYSLLALSLELFPGQLSNFLKKHSLLGYSLLGLVYQGTFKNSSWTLQGPFGDFFRTIQESSGNSWGTLWGPWGNPLGFLQGLVGDKDSFVIALSTLLVVLVEASL